MQQVLGESSSRLDSLRLNYQPFTDGSSDDNLGKSTGTESESLMPIAELLGLNMPRGSLVGVGHAGHAGHGHGAAGAQGSPPQWESVVGSPTRPFSCDDSGYQASHPGSPLCSSLPLEIAAQGKAEGGAGGARRGRRMRLDSMGPFPQSPMSPSSCPSPALQGSFSPSAAGPRAIRGCSQSFSDCGSSLEPAFLMSSSSRSDSPESDSSLGGLDTTNLSNLMSGLYIQARGRCDSGLSVGLSSSLDDQRQHELTNLTNLHALQTLSNKYYQQGQQSPYGSPLSSPLISPEKSWSPGSLANARPSHLSSSLPISLPGSPLYTSSPLRNGTAGSAPGTPPSPGAVSLVGSLGGPSGRMSSSLDSNCTNGWLHRSTDASECDASCTWSGSLPPKSFENPTFSVKVFLGGVPWDISDAMLVNAFKQFGTIRVEWPRAKKPGAPPPKGYAYIIFECEKQVQALLRACSHDFLSGGENWYYKVSSKRMKAKVVQVIPWVTGFANWVRTPSQKLDPQKTVFVGALHGMLSAHGLAVIMNDLFDGVVYAGIDTDKFKYPIGSARVTFNNIRSFLKAVNARFIEIKTDKFVKKVQVDPYLEDSPCSLCSVQHGPYFCRESSCFRYFCRSCWNYRHSLDVALISHSALMRTSKAGSSVSSITDVGMGLQTAVSIPRYGY